MTKIVNGYSAPRIETVNVFGVKKIYDFSFKYKKFLESYQKISEKSVLPDGSKKKKIRYVDYEWELSLEEYGEADDILKCKQIENDEINGDTIFIIPHHADYPFRKYKALIIDEKRELETIIDKPTSAMQGYKIRFENADSIKTVDIADVTFIPVYAFEEDY